MRIELEGLGKSFDGTRVLSDISLDVKEGEFVAFVGPSGCGKSTLLRVIAGLETVDEGEIRFGGRRMNETPAADRGVAMVFQSYALYPHMTVWENMSFSLRLQGVSKSERRAKAAKVAALLQLTDYLDRRPAALSGGQRQRVAIGRALMRGPGIFLFDEPLSNLDASLRAEMRVELARLHRQIGATMIYVTHDQIEAMTMADRLVVLNRGEIVQIGSPMDLYRKPATRFVAEFIGSPRMNVLEGTVKGGAISLSGGDQLFIAEGLPPEGTRIAAGLRPEDLRVMSAGDTDPHLVAKVDLVEHLGDTALLHCRLAGGGAILAKTGGSTEIETGEQIGLGYSSRDLHLFDPNGTRIVR